MSYGGSGGITVQRTNIEQFVNENSLAKILDRFMEHLNLGISFVSFTNNEEDELRFVEKEKFSVVYAHLKH